jgi:hypothetical protein
MKVRRVRKMANIREEWELLVKETKLATGPPV